MKKLFFTLLDTLFALRPIVLVPVWGFALFGYFNGSGLPVASLPALRQTPDISVLAWIAVFSLSVACVYVINQLTDIEVDKKNGGLPLLASGIVSRRQAVAAVVLTAAVSIGLPLFRGHDEIALLSTAGIVLGIIYSCKPAFLSGRPFADFLANALGFGVIAYGVGWDLAGRSFADGGFLLSALPYVLLMCAGSISSTIPDMGGDREAGKNTTAVVLGETLSHRLAALFIIMAAAAAILNKDAVSGTCALATLPIYLLQIVSPRKVFVESTYKIGGALCMLAAACIMPVFLLAGLAVFLATWLYFRLRHKVSYPSLVPAERSR